jgi:hypothetical protein
VRWKWSGLDCLRARQLTKTLLGIISISFFSQRSNMLYILNKLIVSPQGIRKEGWNSYRFIPIFQARFKILIFTVLRFHAFSPSWQVYSAICRATANNQLSCQKLFGAYAHFTVNRYLTSGYNYTHCLEYRNTHKIQLKTTSHKRYTYLGIYLFLEASTVWHISMMIYRA